MNIGGLSGEALNVYPAAHKRARKTEEQQREYEQRVHPVKVTHPLFGITLWFVDVRQTKW